MPGEQILYNRPLPGARLNMAHPLTRDLRGCWLLNENGGVRAMDLSPYGNHGVLTGFDSPPRRSFNGLWMDGTDDYVTVAGEGRLDFPLPISVECWFYYQNSPCGLVNRYDASAKRVWQAFIETPNLTWRITSDGLAGTLDALTIAAPSQSEWHHFVGTHDGNTIRAYLDGKISSTAAGQSSIFRDATVPLEMSREFVGAATYLKGAIGLGRVWSRRLSDDESRELFGNPYGMFLR